MSLPATRFLLRKQAILDQLGVSAEAYHDLSPKGSIDEAILPLIVEINSIGGLVTTSSCSGRISVFLEGQKANSSDDKTQCEPELSRAGPGGKGGGSWLFISHSPVKCADAASCSNFISMLGLKKNMSTEGSTRKVTSRYIHLKFEPMILHILTASLNDAQNVLTAALGAGFRESGAVSLNSTKTGESTPIVAVRSTGYSFDTIVGYQDDDGENIAFVEESYLQMLVNLANERFQINTERIERFRFALSAQYEKQTLASKTSRPKWEDSEARKHRKRKEGLARQQALQSKQPATLDTISTQESSLGNIFDDNLTNQNK